MKAARAFVYQAHPAYDQLPLRQCGPHQDGGWPSWLLPLQPRHVVVPPQRTGQSLSDVRIGGQLEGAREAFTPAHLDEADGRAIGQGRPTAQPVDDPQRRRLKAWHVRHRGRLSTHQVRPELEIVEHVVQPGIAELVGDDVPHVEQAQPPPIGDNGQVLAQAAIPGDLVLGQESALECDVAGQRQHAPVVPIHSGDAEGQRQVGAEHFLVLCGDYGLVERVGRELWPVDDLDLGQVAGVEGDVRHADEAGRRLLRPSPSG